MKSKIAFFLSLDVGLSVTITKEGLLEEALIKPQDPSSRENLTPFIVRIFSMFKPSILTFLDFKTSKYFIN